MRTLTLLFSAVAAVAAERGELVRLWPKDAPGSEGVTAQEVSKPAAANAKYPNLPANFTVTHVPGLYVFLPPKEKATGAAVVIAPGGGHRTLVIDKEGWEAADWFNGRGIAAFVLKYRLARVQGANYKLDEHPHLNAARAIRMVRSRASEWGVDPGRIGFIGFSAGAEVAGMIGAKFDRGTANASDSIDRVSSRPDYNVLVYTGPNLPFPVPADAPPTFLVCTTEDHSHVVPTVKYYMQLEAQKVPAEMHIYSTGPHGFAFRAQPKPLPLNTWAARLEDWLVELGMMRR